MHLRDTWETLKPETGQLKPAIAMEVRRNESHQDCQMRPSHHSAVPMQHAVRLNSSPTSHFGQGRFPHSSRIRLLAPQRGQNKPLWECGNLLSSDDRRAPQVGDRVVNETFGKGTILGLSHANDMHGLYSKWEQMIESHIVLREDGRHAVGSQRTRTPWRHFPRAHAYSDSMPGARRVACSRRVNYKALLHTYHLPSCLSCASEASLVHCGRRGVAAPELSICLRTTWSFLFAGSTT